MSFEICNSAVQSLFPNASVYCVNVSNRRPSGSYEGVLGDFLCIEKLSTSTSTFQYFSLNVAVELHIFEGTATPKNIRYVDQDSGQDELSSVCKWNVRECQEYIFDYEINCLLKIVDL